MEWMMSELNEYAVLRHKLATLLGWEDIVTVGTISMYGTINLKYNVTTTLNVPDWIFDNGVSLRLMVGHAVSVTFDESTNTVTAAKGGVSVSNTYVGYLDDQLLAARVAIVKCVIEWLERKKNADSGKV